MPKQRSTEPTVRFFPAHIHLSCVLSSLYTAPATLSSAYILRPSVDEYSLNIYRLPGPEGNFVFLFVGNEKAILFDTGPVAFQPFKDIVAQLVPDAASRELIIAHTHSHGDHIKGDTLWEDEATGRKVGPFRSVTIVGLSPEEVSQFYTLDYDPDGSREDATSMYDLGGRSLQLFWIRGHEDSHIAVYDESVNVLVTGDVLYPGEMSSLLCALHSTLM